MRLQFLGGAQTVTGSRTLVEHESYKLLVDCGLFQGFKHLRLRNREPLPVDPRSINSLLLTHAHLDHSGYIPLLVKNGFRGKVFATRATRDLCEILLRDSGYLQEEEARYANKKGFSKHTPALPLYTQEDAVKAMDSFEVIEWRESLNLTNKLRAEFHPAGHLFGAASIWLFDGKTSLTFSGDLGRENALLVRPPRFERSTDYLVLESTYGNRLHTEASPKDELKDIINRTLARGGVVLIPSFAVGRAQEILYCLSQLRQTNEIPDVPIYLNSPMAGKTNTVVIENFGETKLSKTQLRDICSLAKIVDTPEDSIKLNEKQEPMIIIAASGMATGGRVLHHLKSFAPDPKNAIVFAGFQAGGTRGEAIVNGAKEVKIHGEFWPIAAEVVQLDSFSGHGDFLDLLNWVKALPHRPKKIFINHGEESASDALRIKLVEQFAVDAVVAEHLQSVQL